MQDSASAVNKVDVIEERLPLKTLVLSHKPGKNHQKVTTISILLCKHVFLAQFVWFADNMNAAMLKHISTLTTNNKTVSSSIDIQ